MKMTNTIGRPYLKTALLAPLAMLGLAAAPHAQAEDILLAQTTLVNGSQSTVDSFSTSGAGRVTVSLQSLAWPAQLSALSFSATSSDKVMAYWNGGGDVTSTVTTFNVDGPGTYFAHIMATAGASSLNLGLYSLMMTFTPSAVPLPASGWMLLVGMFVIGGLVRTIRPSSELMGTARA